MKLYEKYNDSVKCLLCPNFCVLNKNNKRGLCNIREYSEKDSSIINPYSGIISASSIDPIEKKPLYHFMPGTSIFSIGFYGCTLKCSFCQNYQISQNLPPEGSSVYTPSEIVDFMLSKGIKSAAFTYSEPLLYYEWVYQTSKLAFENNIKTVLVTNGFINENISAELLKYIDAVNIDLKSFSDNFYRKYLKGSIEPVKNFIRKSYENSVHTEITTLIIPGLNDSDNEITELTDFISSISDCIPLHINAYSPNWKMDIRAAGEDEISHIASLARKKLRYVYEGNIGKENTTKCSNCSSTLIRRTGYKTVIENLDIFGKCSKCRADNYIKM